MEASVFPLTCTLSLPSTFLRAHVRSFQFKFRHQNGAVIMRRSKSMEDEPLLEGMPTEYYDDEWQAQQREKDKELQRLRRLEDEEEERKIEKYREIGMRLKGIRKKMS